MSNLPKLKVRPMFKAGNENEVDICDIEQVKSRFDFAYETVILVEGQVINSYEELIELARQDKYKDREFLEVTLLPFIAGG